MRHHLLIICDFCLTVTLNVSKMPEIQMLHDAFDLIEISLNEESLTRFACLQATCYLVTLLVIIYGDEVMYHFLTVVQPPTLNLSVHQNTLESTTTVALLLSFCLGCCLPRKKISWYLKKHVGMRCMYDKDVIYIVCKLMSYLCQHLCLHQRLHYLLTLTHWQDWDPTAALLIFEHQKRHLTKKVEREYRGKKTLLCIIASCFSSLWLQWLSDKDILEFVLSSYPTDKSDIFFFSFENYFQLTFSGEEPLSRICSLKLQTNFQREVV